MDALKLLFAFSPWIAFWIIAAGHSMARLQAGIVVAAVMVVIMGITRLHRGLILWAGVAFFAFAIVAVAVMKNMWVILHLGVLASGTLCLAALLSIIIGRPFTEDYARDHVAPELWNSPRFIRSCYAVTGVWTFVFLANASINAVKPSFPGLGEWAWQTMQIGMLVSGVVFTTAYSRWARRQRQAAMPVAE